MKSEAFPTAPRPRHWAWAGLAAALAIYATGLLWPFALRVPTRVVNAAVWTSAGTLRFEEPGLAVSPDSPAWQETTRELSRFRISLRARSFNARQNGPARLLALSRDTYAQNVMIGQAGDDLVVRLRGLCRAFRAHAMACPKELRIPAVFATSEWVDIDLLVEPNRASLRAGSQPPLEMRIADQALRGWDTDHRLALGNDVSGLRPWLGELQRVTVETPLGLEDWLDPARLTLPDGFWLLNRQPKLLPFYHVSRADVVVNLLLYVPLAMLIAACLRPFGMVQFLFTASIIMIISTTFEFGQIFMRNRNFSATDIFLNSVGGTAAAYLIYIVSENQRR